MALVTSEMSGVVLGTRPQALGKQLVFGPVLNSRRRQGRADPRHSEIQGPGIFFISELVHVYCENRLTGTVKGSLLALVFHTTISASAFWHVSL